MQDAKKSALYLDMSMTKLLHVVILSTSCRTGLNKPKLFVKIWLQVD
jgi:hypothetical protein